MSGRTLRDRAAIGLRRAAALAGAWTGSSARTIAARRGRAAILMYHRVLPDRAELAGIEPGMYVRASTFERHLAWLGRHARVRTLGELLREPPPAAGPPVVVLTFDDGWRDNLTEAWPRLRRRGMSATLFAVRDWVAAGRGPEGDCIRPGELRELVAEGLEVGAHSASHPRLDRLDPTAAEREMRLSREAIADWTGRACELFAYPFGAHDERTAALARGLFRASVVVGGGWWHRACDPARLPRIGIHDDMTSSERMFAARLARGDG